MSARDLKHGCVGFRQLKTSRGYEKTLKTEALRLIAGNDQRLGLTAQTDYLELICAEEEKPHERQSHASGGTKNQPATVRRYCPGKHSEADKPTKGSAVSKEAAG